MNSSQREPLGLVSSSQIYCVCFCFFLKDIKAASFAHILELHIWGRDRREALFPAEIVQRAPGSCVSPALILGTSHTPHHTAR